MPYESFALPQFFNRSPPLRVLRLVLDFFLGQCFFCMSVGIFCLFQVFFRWTCWHVKLWDVLVLW